MQARRPWSLGQCFRVKCSRAALLATLRWLLFARQLLDSCSTSWAPCWTAQIGWTSLLTQGGLAGVICAPGQPQPPFCVKMQILRCLIVRSAVA